jgi:hypothetical protein
MRTVTDIQNEIKALQSRRDELRRERTAFSRDEVEYSVISWDIDDINANIDALILESQAQAAWDSQNIFERN